VGQKKVNKMQMWAHHAAWKAGRVVGAIFFPDLHFRKYSFHHHGFDLKTSIYTCWTFILRRLEVEVKNNETKR
jgi:hypothetical protein